MTEVKPSPAATVTLVRDAPLGLEVLMLQRSMALKFMPGAYVFPGGALDPGDDSAELHGLCVGLDDAAASRALGLARGGLAYWIAAIREAFEEAGILLQRRKRRPRARQVRSPARQVRQRHRRVRAAAQRLAQPLGQPRPLHRVGQQPRDWLKVSDE